MDARTPVRRLFLVLVLALAGVHLAVAPPPPAVAELAFVSPHVSIISAPRESLPRPVHDEATCAFCQAAAFVPHSPKPASTPAIDHAEHHAGFTHPEPLSYSRSSRPHQSRAPPELRVV